MKKNKISMTMEHLLKEKGCSCMLDSTLQGQIQDLFEQGQSIRHIAKRLGISRQSVRKYKDGTVTPKTELRDCFRNYLKSNAETIKSLFLQMNGHCVPLLRKIEETYKGKANLRSLQTFCKQFRKEQKKLRETTPFRYETQPGDHLQIDFGETDVMISGKKIRVHFFVGVLGYSRRLYVKAFTSENTESWLNGIECAFKHFNGVPLAIVSDNTKCLVTTHHGQEIRLNERYHAFCRYWRVKPIVCTPYKPRSKGKCERMVRYFKENALPGKEFECFDDLQKWIDLWMVKYSDVRKLSLPQTIGPDTPAERFIQNERSELRVINRPLFTSIREETRKADKCGLIRIENKLYKLPKEYANQTVMLQITDTEIIFHTTDNQFTRLDSFASIYTARQQDKTVLPPINQVSQDYAIWGNNTISRSLDAYAKLVGEIKE